MSARPTRSFLLSTTSAPRPDSSIRLASSRVLGGGGLARVDRPGRRRRSARADRAPSSPTRARCSVSIERRRRMPAVSTSTYSRPPNANGVSIGSRVVPGWSCDQHALLAEQAVDQRRLADVGLAHEREAGSAVSPSLLGAQRRRAALVARAASPTDRVQQLADAAAVAGRDREHLAGSRARRPRRRPPRACAVDLVGGDQHRLARLRAARAPPRCRRAVTPSRASTTNTTRSASSSARSDCWRMAPRMPVGRRVQPAGVDDAEARRAPVARAVAAVAGDAGHVLDQRRPAADQAVEQRRLADVRPPDQRDQRRVGSGCWTRALASRPRRSSGRRPGHGSAAASRVPSASVGLYP